MELKRRSTDYGKKYLLAGAAAALLLALLGGLLYRNLSDWRSLETAIRHTHAFLETSEKIFSRLSGAEAAARAYTLSGSPEALADYDRAVSAMDREMAALRRVEAGRRERAGKMAELASGIKDRRAQLDAMIVERRNKGQFSRRLPGMIRTGLDATDRLEEVVRALQEDERRDLETLELSARARRTQRGILFTMLSLVVFLILSGALGVAVYFSRRDRLAGEALADTNARLNSVLAAAHQVGIIATDLKGKIILFNHGAERMLGYKAEELVGLKTPEAFHSAEEVARRGLELSERLGRPVTGFGVFIEALSQGSFESREWTYIRKDGRHFPVELVVTGLKDHAGRLNGYLGIATDISARKSSQLKMRKLSAAVKASPTSIVITDKDARIEYANPKFFELTGYSERELIGQNPRLIASGKTAKSTYKDMWDTLLAGRVWQGDLLNRKKTGELFWEHASISPVKDPRGQITNFVAVKLDITDRMLAQREMEKARDAAVELARLKSEFLANMSHEIRTPMNAIIGMTGLLLDTQLTAQQRDYVKTVNGAGEALLDIINDILDFSKIESGKLSIENLDFNLRETVETTADLLAPRAQAKGLELACFIDEGLPQTLNGDQGRLRQVLLNLLGNAVKFTEKGDVVLRATRVKEENDRVLVKFEVRDTGIGIPEQAQKNLFQVFTQADASTTRKFGGTGLGLSISKKLVELMGGEIGLESAHGRGSVFWFTLPLGVRGAAAPQEPAAAEVAGIRALVIDDSAANREIVCSYLRVWRLRPEEAASGREALEVLRREAAGGDPFRLAVLDMQMPGMDGLMLGSAMKDDAALAGIRKVMMTSLGHEIRQPELDEAGIYACLPKPVRPQALRGKIAQALGAAAAEKEPAAPTPDGAAEAKKYFRVLIAEDNIVNQKVTINQLEKLGYESDVAANGIEVLAALKRRPYDLVLMDCQMPEMDGFQATAEIRKSEGEGRRLPIVAMTANALQGDKEKCLAAGMDGYIPKPVRIETLAEALSRWDTSMDASVLKGLKDLAGPENPAFLAELANAYLGDLPGRLQAIRDSLKAGDKEALRQAAHALKGSSGNVGARRMQKLCLLLEQAGREGAMECAVDMLPDLEKEAAAARTALEKIAAEALKKP